MGTEIYTSSNAALNAAGFEPALNKPHQAGVAQALAASATVKTVQAVQANNPAQTAAIDLEALEQVASALTQMMGITRKGLDFRVDELNGLPIVSVTDMQTGELIRQIPTEEALALAEKMSEIAGLLMKTEA